MTNICFMRNKKGFTQQYMADMIGVSKQAYIRYEQFGFPYADRISALAKVFGCSADYLLDSNEKFPPENLSSDLSVEEQMLLEKYRQLSDNNKIAQVKHLDYLLFTQENELKSKIS